MQDLRNYVILPSTPEEAQLCADKLVEMGEDVDELENFAKDFKDYPTIYFEMLDGCWSQRVNNLDRLAEISGSDFLSGKLPMSKSEYWEQRCRLAEALMNVPNTVDYEDLDRSQQVILDAYQDFLANNQEPK